MECATRRREVEKVPSDVDFFYVKTDIFEDEKIRLIESMPDADTLLVLWLKIIAQAAKCNAEGWIYLKPGKPYSDEHFATLWRRPINTIRLALKLFQDMEMIQRNGNGIFVTNFMLIQNAQTLDRIREATRERVRRLRERRRLALPVPDDVTLHDVTGNADTDTDTRYKIQDNIPQLSICNVTNDDFRLNCGQTIGWCKSMLLKQDPREKDIKPNVKRLYYLELKRVGVPIDELMKEAGIKIDFPTVWDEAKQQFIFPGEV